VAFRIVDNGMQYIGDISMSFKRLWEIVIHHASKPDTQHPIMFVGTDMQNAYRAMAEVSLGSEDFDTVSIFVKTKDKRIVIKAGCDAFVNIMSTFSDTEVSVEVENID